MNSFDFLFQIIFIAEHNNNRFVINIGYIGYIDVWIMEKMQFIFFPSKFINRNWLNRISNEFKLEFLNEVRSKLLDKISECRIEWMSWHICYYWKLIQNRENILLPHTRSGERWKLCTIIDNCLTFWYCWIEAVETIERFSKLKIFT